MAELLAMAWRNVRRNRRRTALNVAALSIGTAVLFLALGWIAGYDHFIFQGLIEYQTGHLQIQHAEYYAERFRLPVDLLVEDYATRRDAVAALPGVAGATGRTTFGARIGYGTRGTYVSGVGIDPAHESEVGVLPRHIVAGSLPAASPTSWVVLGAPLAASLGVEVGQAVYLRAVDRHGAENLVHTPVVALFRYGYPIMDENLFYIDAAAAAQLLDTPNAVTEIVVRLHEGTPLDRALAAFNARLPAGTRARPWQDYAQAAVAAVHADVASFQTMIAVVYLLIILGILNSISMSVHERRRELAALRAIGMRRNELVALVMAEGFWLAVLAVLCAALMAAPVAWWLGARGLDITSAMPADLPVPFGERFTARFAPRHVLFSVTTAVGSAVLGSILPALRAARSRVAEGLRGK